MMSLRSCILTNLGRINWLSHSTPVSHLALVRYSASFFSRQDLSRLEGGRSPILSEPPPPKLRERCPSFRKLPVLSRAACTLCDSSVSFREVSCPVRQIDENGSGGMILATSITSSPSLSLPMSRKMACVFRVKRLPNALSEQIPHPILRIQQTLRQFSQQARKLAVASLDALDEKRGDRERVVILGSGWGGMHGLSLVFRFTRHCRF